MSQDTNQAEELNSEESRKTRDSALKPDPLASIRDKNWAAEVSHELKRPIANVKLLVETLLDGAKDEPETAERMLNKAKQEIERLEILVADVLSIEQVAHKHKDLERSYVPLAMAADYALDSVRELAGEKGITVTAEIERGFLIFANPDQLNQVVLNLVENAVKYTGEGGKVCIKSGDVPGSLTVSDTGIGIPQNEIPKIFNRFYRVDRTRLKGSTGLGLSIVRHIAELHGAKINVTSEEGSGSVFALEFPHTKRI